MEALPKTFGPVVPLHVAIIMDGNGRWAKARGLPRAIGHQRGAEAARRTVQGAAELGIGYLTLFGFSSENWSRPATEVDDLMQLLRFYLEREIEELHRNGIRLSVIGDRQRLSPAIVRLIENAETMTSANARMRLTMALSYGGRAEIAMAARRIAIDVAAGRIAADRVDEDLVQRYLFTADMPDPDLVIRTSGEKRFSNFLLWQSAYSELVFVEKHWPEFGKDDLAAAIQEFSGRERRYGRSA
ncbi:isoprenyl transferase [Hypericibacter terrae]|uniref:Isoprenyl transferase n=1 Tax=Hypericibacter terrae TaxID=2602015 RepID=A0A5J6MIS8_9PROT|nr:isoprenyl transferase [Hypericibacter terrae]QEX17157.1 isoprenyl transferase [Hypericibacter terrae]